MVIPQHYNRDITLGRMPQVLIAANAVNGTKGSMGAAYLSQIVYTNASPSAAAIQSKIYTLYLYNKHLNFKLFMIPALFAIVMMLMTGFLPTLNIVSEKEAGTIEQINVTPISKWTFILAKLIPYWVIAFFIITVCLFIACAVYCPYLFTGNVAGSILLIFRTDHFQLLRHHAASYLRDVVFRGHPPSTFRSFHAYSLYAFFSLSHNIHQSCKLFHRSNAHCLYSWW